MHDLEVINVGLYESQASYPLDFVIEYPKGFGHWSLMLFHCPFEVRTPRGLERSGSHTFLINSPDYPMWHRATQGPFRNDWVHLDGSDLPNLVETHGLPVNIPFWAEGAITGVAGLIRDIHREKALQDRFWEQAAARRVLDVFLLLDRSRRVGTGSGYSQAEAGRIARFRELRLTVAGALREPWTIERMAEFTTLSPSRFTALYKRFFGVAPFDDLLNMRLENAKVQLANSTLTVEAAAHQAGFRDVRHFSRTFRAATGLSPGLWRLALG